MYSGNFRRPVLGMEQTIAYLFTISTEACDE